MSDRARGFLEGSVISTVAQAAALVAARFLVRRYARISGQR